MLKNANYIYDNVIIADEVNTTKQYCKKTTGVDLSVKNFYNLKSPGIIKKDRTVVGQYELISPIYSNKSVQDPKGVESWFLAQGSYLCELNEGCKFGPNDVGYIILRSSLNRNCVSLISAVWDPNFTTQDGDKINNMSVRITVDTPQGIFIEKNARVGQLLVFEIEDGAEQYHGQFQNKGLK